MKLMLPNFDIGTLNTIFDPLSEFQIDNWLQDYIKIKKKHIELK